MMMTIAMTLEKSKLMQFYIILCFVLPLSYALKYNQMIHKKTSLATQQYIGIEVPSLALSTGFRACCSSSTCHFFIFTDNQYLAYQLTGIADSLANNMSAPANSFVNLSVQEQVKNNFQNRYGGPVHLVVSNVGSNETALNADVYFVYLIPAWSLAFLVIGLLAALICLIGVIAAIPVILLVVQRRRKSVSDERSTLLSSDNDASEVNVHSDRSVDHNIDLESNNSLTS